MAGIGTTRTGFAVNPMYEGEQSQSSSEAPRHAYILGGVCGPGWAQLSEWASRGDDREEIS